MFKPFFKLVQCFNCATFGHLANKCQSESACPTCTGTHSLNKCNNKYNHCCINCLRNNLDPSGHLAWDTKCPIRKAHIKNNKKGF